MLTLCSVFDVDFVLFSEEFVYHVVEPLYGMAYLRGFLNLVLGTLLPVEGLVQELGVRVDLRILLADLVGGRIFKLLHY